MTLITLFFVAGCAAGAAAAPAGGPTVRRIGRAREGWGGPSEPVGNRPRKGEARGVYGVWAPPGG